MTAWLIVLTIVVVALVAGLYYAVRKSRQGTPEAGQETREGRPLRWNVLIVLLLAYIALGGLFVGMVEYGLGPQDAFDNISVPFVALIGGTLAVVKDLL
jgi:Na+/H+ antiporter NhaD/arsenite permease-like protein